MPRIKTTDSGCLSIIDIAPAPAGTEFEYFRMDTLRQIQYRNQEAMTTMTNLLAIQEIICDILEIDPEEMTPTSRFKEDHDADSLRAVEILASLEKTFKLEIPQDELQHMANLENVAAVLRKHGWED
jgi:acyl carrier protein